MPAIKAFQGLEINIFTVRHLNGYSYISASLNRKSLQSGDRLCVGGVEECVFCLSPSEDDVPPQIHFPFQPSKRRSRLFEKEKLSRSPSLNLLRAHLYVGGAHIQARSPRGLMQPAPKDVVLVESYKDASLLDLDQVSLGWSPADGALSRNSTSQERRHTLCQYIIAR